MTGPAPVKSDARWAVRSTQPKWSTKPSRRRAPAAGPRLWALPQVRHWLVLGILLSAAVVALGLAAQLTPGFSAAELGVDQDLSQHHAAALTAVAMALNVVFGPVAGLALIGAAALYIWLFRGGLVKAVAFGLVASSGWVASEFFKIIVARQRPSPALLFDPLAPETGSNSFPSGHVSFAVALGFAVYFLARGTRWAKVTAVAAACGGARRSLVTAVHRRPLPHGCRGVVPGLERSRGPARGAVERARATDRGPASCARPASRSLGAEEK